MGGLCYDTSQPPSFPSPSGSHPVASLRGVRGARLGETWSLSVCKSFSLPDTARYPGRYTGKGVGKGCPIIAKIDIHGYFLLC
jgi:hypothetical protein